MGINNYNDNEEKFSETLKSLKELPKVNAPEDFEFNLMMKIQNGEFAPEIEEKRQSKLLWILAPAGLVVSTLILFITFSKSDLEQQLSPMQHQGSIYAGKVNDSVTKDKPAQALSQNQAPKRKVQTQTPAPVQNQEFFPDPNMFVKDFSYSPLSQEGSYNLDNLAQGKRNENVSTARFHTQNGILPIPDELLMKTDKAQNSLKAKNAVKDSLKNLPLRNDFLKLRKNVKR